MISKAIEVINIIITKLNERNKPETIEYIGVLADIVNDSLKDKDLWSTDELKKFNGLMKYIILAIENSDIDFAINIFRNDISPLFSKLLLKNVVESNDLSSKIDDTTNEIKSQYTDFMYPNMWKGVIPADLKEKIKSNELGCVAIYDLDYIQHIACRKYIPTNKLNILIAGCGTGESGVVCALRYPEANFTFVDISPSSLKMTKRYIDELNITNVSIIQEDIMTMKLEKKFDIIISTGVIHHLSNPSLGVKNLKEHLNDLGVLSVMVYAEYGRFEIGLFQEALKIMLKGNIEFNKGIEYVKAIFKEVGVTNRIVNIAWKQDVNLGDQHIVDLLLNVNENRYNIDSLCKMLEVGGMKIVEFTNMSTVNPDSYLNGNSVREICNNLSYIDKCKIAELINGRITKHNFYAIKNENKYSKLSVFDKDANNYYIYKSPYLSEVSIKRLGSEGLFLRLEPSYFEEENFSQYRDLPIDRYDKTILDLCNGVNKIGTIIQRLKGVVEASRIKQIIEKMIEYKMLFLHE